MGVFNGRHLLKLNEKIEVPNLCERSSMRSRTEKKEALDPVLPAERFDFV
jgi:hypothetical protein